MTYDPAGVEKASRDLLVAIGEDPEREGLVGTPDRMARAWREMCKGLTEDRASTCAPSSTRARTSWSWSATLPSSRCASTTCSPFYGRAHVATSRAAAS